MPARTKPSRLAPMFSSKSDEWTTPTGLYEQLDAEFGFTLDAAATAENTKCDDYFDRNLDALAQDWGQHTVWLNPPYSRGVLCRFIDKTIRAAALGATIVLLVPNRPDTRWYRACVEHANEVRHVEGRLRFGDATEPAPFPSAIFVFRQLPWLRHAALDPQARFVKSKHRSRDRTRAYTIQLRPRIEHDDD